jgi:hypothetical protein
MKNTMEESEIHLNEIVNDEQYCGWTKHIQSKFEEYLRLCNERCDKHSESGRYFAKWHRWLKYPSIFVSITSTVLASMNSSEASFDTLSLSLLMVSGVSTFINTIISFLEYQARSELHSQSSGKYFELARRIESQLFLLPEKRHDPKFMFESVTGTFNSIIMTEPFIPSKIDKVDEYEDEYDDDIV